MASWRVGWGSSASVPSPEKELTFEDGAAPPALLSKATQPSGPSSQAQRCWTVVPLWVLWPVIPSLPRDKV